MSDSPISPRTASVNSYSEIQAFLEQLPPPAPGKKRMFRGQTNGYQNNVGLPSLLPALVREGAHHNYDPAWLVSIQMYSMAFDEHGASTPYDTVYLWGPALLQHYGPGSCYLDVTSALDVALWFAIYQRHEKWLAIKQGNNLPRSQRVSWHTLADLADPAVRPIVYVLDAASWTGEGRPAHGGLVELTALDVAGKLPDQARRLHQQVGSLLYSELRNPQGPNLGSEVVAMMNFTGSFDLTTVPSYGRAVRDVFPPPSRDPFYTSLLRVPAQLNCDPNRLEHPLAIPCYLEQVPDLPTSDATGSRESPVIISADQAASIADLQEYSALGNALNPDLMLRYAVATDPTFGEPVIPTTADGKQFRLADATPFLMEGPLWSYLPSCHTEESRGEWIQSALPIGIASTLANRPTDNIYIEMSTIDVQYPQKEGAPHGSAVRGIWTVRSSNRYWCTVYRTEGAELISAPFEFRFFPQTGQFIHVPSQGDETSETSEQLEVDQPQIDVAEKALFTSLLLLRELSPGFKPPSTFSGFGVLKNGVIGRAIGVVLEPQLGIVHTSHSSPFLVPRALNGTTYARSSGADSLDSDAWKKSEDGFDALMDAFRRVKESYYLMDAGAELGEICIELGQLKEGLDVVSYALAAANTVEASPTSQTFAGLLEVQKGKILHRLNDLPNSFKALNRAIAIQKQLGHADRLIETQNLVNEWFPPPVTSAGGPGGGEQAIAN
jgi:hypothetical protein